MLIRKHYGKTSKYTKEDGRGGKMVITSATEMEGLLLGLEERMLIVEERYLEKKQCIWDSEEVTFGENEEFLQKKEEFLLQTEEFWAKKGAFYRERDRKLEENRAGLQGHVFKSEVELGIDEPAEELLPGIPDEITLTQITTKLTWRELHFVSSASRGWLNAIRSHQVYDGKVHSKLTETFVVVLHYARTLSLRSLKDNSYFQLPPISHLGGGIPSSSTCIALDGKIYVLGGAFGGPSDKVYVLDIAGQRSWTLCASMHKAKSDFRCGVLDGKIYVFGGRDFRRDLCEAEVYDPKENTWRSIRPMSSPLPVFQVEPLKDELVIYRATFDGVEQIDVLEVYCPLTDDWTKKSTYKTKVGPLFGVHGKLHMMHSGALLVHDFAENSWTPLNYSQSLVAFDRPRDFTDFIPFKVSVIGDELLATGSLWGVQGRRFRRGALPEYERFCALRSIGFGSQKKVIEWREEKDWPTLGNIHSTCSIQL